MEDRLWKENPPRRVCSYILTPTLSQDVFRRAKNRATEFGVNLTQAVDIAGSDGRFHRNSIRHFTEPEEASDEEDQVRSDTLRCRQGRSAIERAPHLRLLKEFLLRRYTQEKTRLCSREY